MKKHILLALLLIATISVKAQNADSVTIEKKGSWGVNLANVGLSNWAGGGENSLAIGTVFNTSVVRKKGNGTWKNQFDFALGGAKVGEQDFRKTDDNIILLSQYSKGIKENLSWSLTGILRTQLLIGNTFADDPMTGEEVATKISNFMAPGYLSLNLGIDHQIGKHLSISFAPAAGKFTFVSDDDLAAVGAYGVDIDEHVRSEFGTNLLASLSLPIMDNITLTSTANLFTPYSDTFGTIDVNWETLLVMKINKWFNATFGTQLIYDADIFFEQETGPPTRELQFKHVLNFGANFALFTSN